MEALRSAQTIVRNATGAASIRFSFKSFVLRVSLWLGDFASKINRPTR